ncbi:DNA phosphorothioation-dependent restriction protein DptF [Clostridium botulinum]|nr:DNA phosphorothioation-dependent restriction protein DptF [Clostridium botulinum]
MEKKKCLIRILNKLKTSSKEAVEGIENFSDFKDYMHVNRKVETEFEELINHSNNIDKPQLLLICGSVGDGKSHLISYFKKNKNEIINNFDIHNDATESLDPRKTSIETLNDVLKDFSDDNIGNNTRKFILAINLGTLTNFIDSEYGDRFTRLKKYINNQKILEEDIIDNKFNKDSYFQCINFTDFHMYTLTSEGPKSKYIKDIFDRVFSKDEENPFYKEYKETCCSECVNYSRCPIKENYEELLIDVVKENIIQKLIETIVKNKVIISTRALLNFIYDIVVDSSLDNLTEERLIEKILKYNFMDYLKSLTANIIYANKDTSNIIASMNSIDPLNIRNEKLDELLVNLNNTERICDYFKTYVDNNQEHYYYKRLVMDESLDVVKSKKLKKDQVEIKCAIIKFFFRITSIKGKNSVNIFNDQVYNKYMKYLYNSNRLDRCEMKELLTFVKEVVYKWNGPKLKNGQIHLSLGKNQSKFKVYENLEFGGRIEGIPREETNLHKFINTINLTYQTKNSPDKVSTINIDYLLFDLIGKVNSGYRPNKSDKNNFINFVDFVKKLQEYGANKENVLFDRKIGDKVRKFEFKIDEYGDYCLVEM